MESGAPIEHVTSRHPEVATKRRSSAERLMVKLRECLGEGICNALEDPLVVEVMLNPDGKLFVERLGKGIERLGSLDATAAEIIIGSVAHAVGAEVHRGRPILSAEMPVGGHRFEGLLPPVVRAPSFSIRRRAIRHVRLSGYTQDGILRVEHVAALRQALRAKKNIVISGGSGSGKTTLANALLAELAEISPEDRIVVLEDTVEIECSAKNTIALRSSDGVGMDALLKSTLRLRPDRIIVGEVRDGAALTLLKAWNTGHPGGITTVHANSAYAALERLEHLTAEVSPRPIRSVIGQAVDLIVSIERAGGTRQVKELVEVVGMTDTNYQTKRYAFPGAENL